MPGKCCFNPLWTLRKEYMEWLRASENNHKSKCSWCCKEIDISNMGEAALKVHMKGAKHSSFKKNISSVSAGITDFFTKPKNSVVASSPNPVNINPSHDEPGTSSSSSTILTDLVANSKDVLDAEILWCLKMICSHYSYKSNNDIGKLFSRMFPDSAIAQRMSCSERKMAYLCHFGLVPYFQNAAHEEFKAVLHFTLLFDETLNKINQKKQLDMHIRYWKTDQNKVITRYLTSIFMGHATAADIFTAFQTAVKNLNLRKLLQISMDGPSVNWKFYEILQSELRKEHNVECISIGSCGLHILNIAFRKGEVSVEWDIPSILTSLYYLFKDSPARREDFITSSDSKKLPLKFCYHRWLENSPVSLRAYEMWKDVVKYVKLVESCKLPKVSCKSFQVLGEATKDKLTPVKLLFFACVADIKPFLEMYQSDKPLVPFFSSDIHKLIKQCLQHFRVLQDEFVEKISSSIKYLCDFDFAEKKSYSAVTKVSLGFRGDKLLNELYTKKEITDKSYMSLKHDCQTFIFKMLEKLMEKCPVNYSIVRNSVCLDPKYMIENSTKAHSKLKNLLVYLSQKGHISEEDCDAVLLEFSHFLENVKSSSSSDFRNFNVIQMRLDTFLQPFFEDKKYPKLWEVFKIILTLSHIQASVERGFSVNKNIEIENLSDNSYIAQRVVHDYIKQSGGIDSIIVTKEMRIAASSAHSKYRLFLEKKQKENEVNDKKRKLESEEFSLKKRKGELEKEITNLESKANELAKKAEYSQNFSLLKKSNEIRKLVDEKKEQLKEVHSMCEKRPQTL